MVRVQNHTAPSSTLLALSTAVPPHVIEQTYAADLARRLFAHRMEGYEKLAPVFENTGIETRYAVCPIDWYNDDHDLGDRNDAYIKGACELFSTAARRALDNAGLEAGDVDTIVTVSSTGIATPTIEARVLSTMGFKDNVARVPVFGLGCAGGVTGLTIASGLAKASPGSIVLLVVIELCTLSFRKDELSKSNLVATALFGDGAAAAVISTNGHAPLASIEYGYEHTWPDTLNIMGWRVDPLGLGAIFDKSIPHLVETQLKKIFGHFLSRFDLKAGDIDNYIFHPGGTKVVNALENVFDLQQGSLALERDILRRYGNMSAATILFVLHDVLASGLEGRSFLSALGPGFTATFATLRS